MPGKAKSYLSDVWQDTAMPILDGPGGPLERLDVDVESFTEWFGPRLSEFRASVALKAQMPTMQEDRDFITNLKGSIGSLCPLLALTNAPIRAAGLLRREAVKADMEWRGIARDVVDNLARIQVLVDRAAKALSISAPPGRPSTAARDRLLAEVTSWLVGPLKKKSLARLVAGNVLTACRIQAGADATLKKAVRRGKKSS